MSFPKLRTWVILSVILCACVHTYHLKDDYDLRAKIRTAEEFNDAEGSRNAYGMALEKARQYNADPQELATLNYEYGRASGIVCNFVEAENHLLEAMKLDEQSSGPVHMDLVELARLNYDQKKYSQAIPYFERAILVLQQMNGPKLAPIGLADILDEYSHALIEIGKSEESRNVHERAERLRRDNPMGESITDRTPYGTKCDKH
ncbi:MAG: tetratricopeptide repeat protein [Nitrospirae bacterium]|nr:tetratricopeptide repeat protein [Nitrospirota bacterium]